MTDATTTTRRTAPAWIDRELVETALRVGRDDPDLTVAGFSVSPAIALGENYASDMFRVSVELADSSEKPSLIVKIIPQTLSEDMMEKWELLDKEIIMFCETLPKMFQLLDEKRPGQYQPLAAKCLHWGLKPHAFMVLEDLIVPGFKTAQRRAGLDLAHCSLVVKSLARFHASSVALMEKEPEHMEPYLLPYFNEDMRGMFEPYITGAMNNLLEEMENWPDHVQYASKLHNIRKEYFNRLAREAEPKDGRLNVLLHGDLWVNNIMFKYSEDDLVALRFVDFQLSMVSSPALDLHYFLYTSGNETVHAHHIETLMEEYLTALNDTLTVAGCGHRTISMEQLQRELDDHVFYALHAAISALPIVLADPEHGAEIMQSIDNLVDGDTSNYTNKIYSNKVYTKAMKTFLPILEAKGCFEGY